MDAEKMSLRAVVDKWLAPTSATPARVTRFGRLSANRSRFVCVERGSAKGPLSLFVFRHANGSWCVYPPAGSHPVIACARANEWCA